MDRQTFISQLMKIENGVPAGEGHEECMICRDEYGTISSETGTGEREIRLPCNPKHTIGSNCITTWLQEHNSCPVCRHEFFRAPRTDNYDGNDDYDYEDEDEDEYYDYDNENDYYDSEQEEEEKNEQIEIGLASLQTICQHLCDALGFEAVNNTLRDIATLVASNVWRSGYIQETNSVENFSLAAACVFVAARLVRQGTRMRDIAAAAPVSRRNIITAYQLIYELEFDQWDIDFNHVHGSVVSQDVVTRIGTISQRILLHRLPEPIYRYERR